MPWRAKCYECQQEAGISRPFFETKDLFLASTLLEKANSRKGGRTLRDPSAKRGRRSSVQRGRNAGAERPHAPRLFDNAR